MNRFPFIYRFSRVFTRGIFRVLFRWRIAGAEGVPAQGPVLLVSNHASYLDPPLVGSALRRDCAYLARASLFRNPLFGWYLRRLRVLPVDRDGGSGAGLRVIVNRLQQGEAVLLFPEGTRSPDGRLQKASGGVGLVVLKSGAPVVPVRVEGTYEAWGRHRRLPRLHPLAVKFGPVLRFEAQHAEAAACTKQRLRALYQEVADQIMAAVAAL